MVLTELQKLAHRAYLLNLIRDPLHRPRWVTPSIASLLKAQDDKNKK